MNGGMDLMRSLNVNCSLLVLLCVGLLFNTSDIFNHYTYSQKLDLFFSLVAFLVN